MTPKFTYNDIVVVEKFAPLEFRPGERGWIVAVHPDSSGMTYRLFKPGPVYMIEFEDGEAVQLEECYLKRAAEV